MHRAALTNSVHSSRLQNGEAEITTYTKSTRPYDALTVDSGSSRHFDSSARFVDSLDKSRHVLNPSRNLATRSRDGNRRRSGCPRLLAMFC
jgi:hypothetical protein